MDSCTSDWSEYVIKHSGRVHNFLRKRLASCNLIWAFEDYQFEDCHTDSIEIFSERIHSIWDTLNN